MAGMTMLLGVAFLTASGGKAPAPVKVAVLPCSGPGGAKVATKMAQSLSGEVQLDVVSSRTVAAALKRGKKGRVSPARLAEALELDAVLTCHVSRAGKWTAAVAVRDASGEVTGRLRWTGRNPAALSAQVPGDARRKMVRALLESAAAPDDGEALAEAEDKGAAGGEEDEDGRGTTKVASNAPAPRTQAERRTAPVSQVRGGGEPSFDSARPEVTASVGELGALRVRSARYLDLTIAPSVLSRSFSYSDTLPAGSRDYRHVLPLGPTLAVDAHAFPALAPGLLSHLGLHGSAEVLLGVRTQVSDGTAYSTTGYAFSGGLELRLPVGASHVDLAVEAGRQVFDPGIKENRSEDGPAVAYTYLEPVLGGRLEVTERLYLEGRAGVRLLQGAGELTSREFLRRARGAGLQAGAALGWRLSSALDLRLSASWRRYFFEAAPAEGEPLFGGGAVDQYQAASIGIAYRLGG